MVLHHLHFVLSYNIKYSGTLQNISRQVHYSLQIWQQPLEFCALQKKLAGWYTVAGLHNLVSNRQCVRVRYSSASHYPKPYHVLIYMYTV